MAHDYSYKRDYKKHIFITYLAFQSLLAISKELLRYMKILTMISFTQILNRLKITTK